MKEKIAKHQKLKDSYERFHKEHKLNDTPLFIRKTKGGKLIIDIDDLNAVNVNSKNYLFLEILNQLKQY